MYETAKVTLIRVCLEYPATLDLVIDRLSELTLDRANCCCRLSSAGQSIRGSIVLKSKSIQFCILTPLMLLLATFAHSQTTPSPAAAQQDSSSSKSKSDSSDKLFADPQIRKLKINISPPELERLREDNRRYVRCDLTENGELIYKSVAIKLKGAAGSFREIDDRPALTLNMDRFNKRQTFHALEKFHLNNSVQDESYLHELLCSELFRAAGQPAPRVTHARVWLNGRDVGVYVLKEAFDKRFLKRHFADATGNLYDGGFLQDLDVDLEKDAGDGPDDRSDLVALREACADSDRESRWERVGKLVDIDKFIDFMALELMTGHWDGYTQSNNNYRLYFDPSTGRAHFLAHGMDQVFGDAGFPILSYPSSIGASAVMRNPIWRAKFRDRLQLFLPLFVPPTRLVNRVEDLHQRLLPVFKEMGDEQANTFSERVGELKQRLVDRAVSLQEQVKLPDPEPIEFNAEGLAELPEWHPASETEDALHEQPEVDGQRTTYSIQCGPGGPCIASWRRTVLLNPGCYQLEAQVKTEKVVPQVDDKGSGVGLRISGDVRTNQLSGSSDWIVLKHEFEVLEELREVELIAELRASAGRAWFDSKSLRLRQLRLNSTAAP